MVEIAVAAKTTTSTKDLASFEQQTHAVVGPRNLMLSRNPPLLSTRVPNRSAKDSISVFKQSDYQYGLSARW